MFLPIPVSLPSIETWILREIDVCQEERKKKWHFRSSQVTYTKPWRIQKQTRFIKCKNDGVAGVCTYVSSCFWMLLFNNFLPNVRQPAWVLRLTGNVLITSRGSKEKNKAEEACVLDIRLTFSESKSDMGVTTYLHLQILIQNSCIYIEYIILCKSKCTASLALQISVYICWNEWKSSVYILAQVYEW